MRTQTRWIIRLLLAATALAASAAWALDLKRELQFEIPSQTLGAALLQFSKQAGVQVLTGGTEISRANSPGVSGRFSLDSGLTQLLADTGYVYVVAGTNTISIVPKDYHGRSGSTSALMVALADATAGQSGAQTDDKQATSDESKGSSGSELQEIIVTAQKREERLIEVPQSVVVLSADALAKSGAMQFRDYADSVPGLTFNTVGAGLTQIILRGTTVGADVGSTVALYVDDVPYGASTNAGFNLRANIDTALFDLDRIEVLRGPQGTLYGASSMGGLIKYVPKRPDPSGFSVDATAGLASTKDGGTGYNGAAALNMPLSEKAAMRFSAFYTHDGGYIDNVALNRKDVNQSDIYGARLALAYQPSDAFTLRLTAFAQNISRDGEGTADYFIATRQPVTGELEQTRAAQEPFDQNFRLVSATLEYDFGPTQLISISSYQTMRMPFELDYSPRYVPLLSLCPPFCRNYASVGVAGNTDVDKFTQEVRFGGGRGKTIEWTVGGFYTQEDTSFGNHFVLRDAAGAVQPNDLFAVTSPGTYEEYAGFGNVTWNITSKLDVTGGLRWASNRQATTQNGSGIFIGSKPTARSDESVTTYLANARYRFSPQTNLYARYATGFRPGGPSGVALDPTTGEPLGPPTFDADKLNSYEIGFKGETQDRRFGIDIGAYYVDWDNIQLQSCPTGFCYIANAPGGARIQGLELGLSARPIEGLTFTGAFGYSDASMRAAEPDLGAAKDERLPNVPRFTGTVSGEYQFSPDGLRPTIGATVRHVSDRWAAFNNNVTFLQYYLPEYTMVDLRAGMTFGSVVTQLYVRNLFDELGVLSAYTFNGARPALTQPRTIGIMATTHF